MRLVHRTRQRRRRAAQILLLLVLGAVIFTPKMEDGAAITTASGAKAQKVAEADNSRLNEAMASGIAGAP